MKLKPRILLALILCMVTGVILGVTVDLFVHTPKALTGQREFHLDMKSFETILKHIRASYVNPLDEEEMLEDALKGVLKGLDTHSVYLDEKGFTKLKNQTTGQFGGVGIELAIDKKNQEGQLKVVRALANTPAARAGILPGDILVKIDNKAVKKNTLKATRAKLRGAPGTEISLDISRADLSEALQFDLVRVPIDVNSVKSRWLGDIGYIRITQFQVDTGTEAIKAIKNFVASSNPSMKGLVLDLRGNPGGTLQASVELADAFLDEGKIVYTEGRRASSDLSYNASGSDILHGLPLAILMNKGSASASEIVAGALQDHKRAILIGSKSYGKGSVQTVMPLKNKHAIKLTTALYYTPSGRVINETGLEPDIHVSGKPGKTYLDRAIMAFSHHLRSETQ